jgi:hypothetical protein
MNSARRHLGDEHEYVSTKSHEGEDRHSPGRARAWRRRCFHSTRPAGTPLRRVSVQKSFGGRLLAKRSIHSPLVSSSSNRSVGLDQRKTRVDERASIASRRISRALEMVPSRHAVHRLPRAAHGRAQLVHDEIGNSFDQESHGSTAPMVH